MAKHRGSKRGHAGKVGATPQAAGETQRFSQPAALLSYDDITALRGMFAAYIAWLRSLPPNHPERVAHERRLVTMEAVYTRLPVNVGETVYFSHEELEAILVVVLTYYNTLTQVLPATAEHRAVLSNVEQVLQHLFAGRARPLHEEKGM